MLKRRVLAAALALVMAAAGGMLMLGYVGRADQRAMAGMQTVSVLVLKAPVARGTTAEALGPQVVLRNLPRTAVAPGTLSSLKQVTGRVTTVALQTGEQVLASRFVDPKTLVKPGQVTIPRGRLQISVSVPAPQAVGGNLAAGDRVSIFARDTDQEEPTLVLKHVLISKVVGGVGPTATTETAAKDKAAPAAVAPSGSLMLTFAVTTAEAAKIVLYAPGMWLSLEPSGSAPTAAGPAQAKGGSE